MKGLDQFVQPAACETCPFNETGPGRQLRDSLQPGRFAGILDDLRAEKTFPCHGTTSSSRWTKKTRVCAGALAWQRREGCVPAAIQIVERLAAMRENRDARL